MSAKVIPFGRRSNPPPMTKANQADLIESLLELALMVERGEIAECSACYVQPDGKTGHVYLLPREPKKIFSAIERSKFALLKMLEEDGPR